MVDVFLEVKNGRARLNRWFRKLLWQLFQPEAPYLIREQLEYEALRVKENENKLVMKIQITGIFHCKLDP